MNLHLLLFVVCGGGVLALVKLAENPSLLWGGGRRAESSHGESRWARTSERRLLGRTARVSRPLGDGIVLGFFGRRLLQTPPEDNALVVGVQRSGKTSSVVIPTLLSWSGPVLATSIKDELVRLTANRRQVFGRSYVFAPLDEDTAWSSLGARSVTWNPLAAIEQPHEAVELADLFTAEGKQGPSSHWYLAASSLLAGLVLHERRRGSLRSVLTLLNTKDAEGYKGLLLSAGDQLACELLKAHLLTPEREAGSVASTARSALSLWTDERVVCATSTTDDALDVDRLLMENATLYLVAPAEEAARLRPLFSALIQSLLRKATARARRSGGLLPSRLLVALDEAANFARLPNLATHISTGPGQGLNWLLCFQDLAQLEQGYGSEQARTVWNNCRAHLLLPGQSDLATLEQFSRAIGDETRIYELHNSGRSGSSGRTEQRIGKPLASLDALRRLKEPLLLYANAPPALLRARRWDQVPSWRRLVQP